MAIGTLEVLLVNAKGLGDNDFLGIFSFSFSLFLAGIPSFLIQKDFAAFWNDNYIFSMIAFINHQTDS
jgi:hypothetical protein